MKDDFVEKPNKKWTPAEEKEWLELMDGLFDMDEQNPYFGQSAEAPEDRTRPARDDSAREHFIGQGVELALHAAVQKDGNIKPEALAQLAAQERKRLDIVWQKQNHSRLRQRPKPPKGQQP